MSGNDLIGRCIYISESQRCSCLSATAANNGSLQFQDTSLTPGRLHDIGIWVHGEEIDINNKLIIYIIIIKLIINNIINNGK